MLANARLHPIQIHLLYTPETLHQVLRFDFFEPSIPDLPAPGLTCLLANQRQRTTVCRRRHQLHFLYELDPRLRRFAFGIHLVQLVVGQGHMQKPG